MEFTGTAKRSSGKETVFAHDGITLRVLEERDLEPLRRLRNDPTTWAYLTHIEPIDAVSQRTWFESLLKQKDKKYLVVFDAAHDFLGIVRMDEIDRVNRSIRVGCDIVPEMRGKGFGKKTFRAILKYGFDFQNMHRVWLAVLESNDVAQRLYRGMGFREEGRYRQAIYRDGRYWDYIVMSILEEEYRNGQL